MKEYNEKNLKNKNYAILLFDAEEPDWAIVSLHNEYDKAKARQKYLRKKAKELLEKDICNIDYILVNINDEQVRKSANYKSEV